MEPDFDVAKLRELLDVKTQWEKTEAKKAFVVALNAFKADPPQITKNKTVSFGRGEGKTEYDHATLDQVCDVVGKALAEQGLSHTWDLEQSENVSGPVKVTCILTHVLGHSERVSLQSPPDDSGSKNRIQQIASTVTYLERYTLLAATGLATQDQDNDGGPVTEFIYADQKEELIALIKEIGADNPKSNRSFLKYLGVKTLDEIPADKFDEAKAALKKKRKAQ
ncbi:MAG: ERF family protein [Proteobacteria bacterium]|nr:ERF family protein [Pseudomonadota bacterium]